MLRKLHRQALAAADIVDGLAACPEPEDWREKRRIRHLRKVGEGQAAQRHQFKRVWKPWSEILKEYEEPFAKGPLDGTGFRWCDGPVDEIGRAIYSMRERLAIMHKILGHKGSECSWQ